MSTDEIRCGWKKNKFTIVPLVYQDGKQIKEYNVIQSIIAITFESIVLDAECLLALHV